MIDLKGIRENNLKMTQEKFAELIGISQSDVSRYEKRPETISLELLMRIAQKTGMTPEQLLAYEKISPKMLEIRDVWSMAKKFKNKVMKYTDEECKENKNLWIEGLEDEEILGQEPRVIRDLKNGINLYIKKPKIAVVGHSDAGKSTMINALIGGNELPTSYTPTTSIVVFLKHIDDKPTYMQKDVWVFKKDLNNKSGVWDDNRINDEYYCRELKIDSGGLELLKSYGTRQGRFFEKNEAVAAVAFIDSPMLKNCDFIDLPGYGTGDRKEDEDGAILAQEKADVLIYLSPSNGFLNTGDELLYLKNCMSNVSTIDNLFIVASQAHIINMGNQEMLESILDTKARVLYDKLLTERTKEELCRNSLKKFRDRFFTYSIDIEHTREKFENEFTKRIEAIPIEILDKAKTYVFEYVSEMIPSMEQEIDRLNNITFLDETEGSKKNQLSLIRGDEGENEEVKRKVKTEVESRCQESCRLFREEYRKIINEDNIVSIIKKKGYKKDKSDIKLLQAYLEELIKEAAIKSIEEPTKKFGEFIEQFIKDYEKRVKFDRINTDFFEGFDFKKAFASGLAGIATFGALAAWASTFGNLGAYILIAKGVSLLAGLGISLGGTAAVISAVSSIGGPLTIGIGIALLATLTVFSILGGGWEKKIAKKLVQAFADQNVEGKYIEAIEQYWAETIPSFNRCIESMKKETENQVNIRTKVLAEQNSKKIEIRKMAFNYLKKYFEGMPL